MNNNYEKLNTVHLDDISNLLNHCGIALDYKKRVIKCKFCKSIVTNKNIYSVFKDSGSYKLVCDNHDCIQSLLELVNERKKKRVEK